MCGVPTHSRNINGRLHIPLKINACSGKFANFSNMLHWASILDEFNMIQIQEIKSKYDLLYKA